MAAIDAQVKVAFKVEDIAKVAHEANRAYCETLNDNSQLPWEQAPEWQKQSAIKGVNFTLENPTATPEDQHKAWLADKEADGWTWGEKKDAAAKKHPCMVAYNELPITQRVKDWIFNGVVKSFTLGLAK